MRSAKLSAQRRKGDALGALHDSRTDLSVRSWVAIRQFDDVSGRFNHDYLDAVITQGVGLMVELATAADADGTATRSGHR